MDVQAPVTQSLHDRFTFLLQDLDQRYFTSQPENTHKDMVTCFKKKHISQCLIYNS